MMGGSGAITFWILVPLFLAVGLYLLWYRNRRKKMLEEFADEYNFSAKPEEEKRLQKLLDDRFSIKKEGLVRSISQLSNIIERNSIRLFRAVELLDLNPHGQSYTTHYARIIALFETSNNYEEFFLLDKSMQATPRMPGSATPDPYLIEKAKQAATSSEARHTLSVTYSDGYGLIYFEPLVTGGENTEDIKSLYYIAKKMSTIE